MINKLTFCGDVWTPAGYSGVFLSELANDLVINLEGPITSRSERSPSKICLASDVNSFKKAFPVLPKIACLANNHILDFGRAGFEDTIGSLDSMGIRYFGAGYAADRCNNPLLVEVGGVMVALMGYVCKTTHPIFATNDTPGVAPIDLVLIERDISIARKLGAEKIVLCLHWGEEEVSIPRLEDIFISKELIRLGVDLVIGHHAHCMHPLLITKDKYIFYGLGNALFPDFEYKFPSGNVAWSKQRSWNKRAAVVTYEPRSSGVSWRAYPSLSVNSHNKVIGGAASGMRIWRALPDENKYSSRYKRARYLGHLRLAISRYVAKPRLVSPVRILRSLLTIKK